MYHLMTEILGGGGGGGGGGGRGCRMAVAPPLFITNAYKQASKVCDWSRRCYVCTKSYVI